MELTGNLKREWWNTCKYYSTDCEEKRMTRFRETYEGSSVEEFNDIKKVVYIEWDYWKMIMGYYPELPKPFSKVWDEFNDYWQYNSPGTQKMFNEVELLSKHMLKEWRMKYTNEYPHVYEWDNKQSKVEMWESFKRKWEINVDDYNENKFKYMSEYVHQILREDGFDDYKVDSNYHSFDSYSILEKYEICVNWEMIN